MLPIKEIHIQGYTSEKIVLGSPHLVQHCLISKAQAQKYSQTGEYLRIAENAMKGRR